MFRVIKNTVPYVIAIALTFVIITFVSFASKYQLQPKEIYKVYLDGKVIGNIEDKQSLEEYINDEQKEIKNKYAVEKVYIPSGVDIQKCITYEKNELTSKQVHNIIKEEKPFTVKGYKITLKATNKEDKNIVINVLDKNIFDKSIKSVLKAFIPEEEINKYETDTQSQIETTGSLIEDIYVDQDITIKQTYVSTDEQIFIDEKELTKYLLFGQVTEDQNYTVQPGDTIEKIAYDHQLAVEEFLIVNPEFTSENNLLTTGQQVKIGLINPVIDVVVEKHSVVDQDVKYETTQEYDANKKAGLQTVKIEGQNGLERLTTKIKTVNGETTNVVIVSAEMLAPAVNKVVVVGTYIPGGNYDTSVVASGTWAWPTISQYYISSYMGYRWGRMHAGIDIAGCGYGSPIYAAGAGTVVKALYGNSELGNHVVINHNNGYFTIYEHLAALFVNNGQTVNKGQQIGTMGSSGKSTGTHLHFGLWQYAMPYSNGSKLLNPLSLYR
ncbi:MAG: M23 family metallopeptidase [Bacilli bacterium]